MAQKRVDSHQHVNWHYRDVAGSIQDLDEQDINYCWLLTWYTDPGDPVVKGKWLNPLNVRLDGSSEGITLREILEAKAAYPDRYVVGFCPHPGWPEAAELLRTAYHMHGAQVCGEWKFRFLFDDPRCLEIFRVAGELGMPVVLHLDVPFLPDEHGKPVYQDTWYGGTIENLERALEACPDTLFIGHAPGFWREISSDAPQRSEIYPDGPIPETGKLYGLLDTYSNLYADLSAGSALNALRRDPAHAEEFLTRYADRLLFARDYYGSDLDDFLGTLSLEPEVREKIYWQNAEKLIPAPVK